MKCKLCDKKTHIISFILLIMIINLSSNASVNKKTANGNVLLSTTTGRKVMSTGSNYIY